MNCNDQKKKGHCPVSYRKGHCGGRRKQSTASASADAADATTTKITPRGKNLTQMLQKNPCTHTHTHTVKEKPDTHSFSNWVFVRWGQHPKKITRTGTQDGTINEPPQAVGAGAESGDGSGGTEHARTHDEAATQTGGGSSASFRHRIDDRFGGQPRQNSGS